MGTRVCRSLTTRVTCRRTQRANDRSSCERCRGHTGGHSDSTHRDDEERAMARISLARSGRLACVRCLSVMFAHGAVRVCAVVNSNSTRGIVSIESLHPARWHGAHCCRSPVAALTMSTLACVPTPPAGPASSGGRRPRWLHDLQVPVFVSGWRRQRSVVGGQRGERRARLGGRT